MNQVVWKFVFVSKAKAKKIDAQPFEQKPTLGLANIAPTILKPRTIIKWPPPSWRWQPVPLM